MTPEKFVKMTKEFVEQIEVILKVYDSSMKKCERIDQLIKHFKKEIKSEAENGKG